MSSFEELPKEVLEEVFDVTKGELESKLSKPSTKAGRLQRACLKVLSEHYLGDALPTSLRFLFYEMEGRGVVPKDYRKPDGSKRPRTPSMDISDALTLLRENEIVPWMWLVDETRTLNSWLYASSAYRYVEDRLPEFRLDLWGGEPPPLILCESRSLSGVLRRSASQYLCAIAATNGQVGGFLHTEVGPLIAENANYSGVQRVFYFGDLDYCGSGIEENTRRVLEDYSDLEWERLAIIQSQVDEFALTAIEKPDHRFKPPRAMPAVETEALSQQRIVARLEKRLDEELAEPLKYVLEEEERQRVKVRKAITSTLMEAAEEEGDEE